MRIFVLAVAVATMLVPASALAGAPATGAPKKVDDGDKIICKSERFVGSHMSERICKPRAEWASGRERSKQWLDQNNGTLINDQIDKGEGGGAHIGPPVPRF